MTELVKPLSAKIHQGWFDLDQLSSDWDLLARKRLNGVSGPDITCSVHWARALSRSLLRDADVSLLEVLSGEQSVAILPVSLHRERTSILRKAELRLITEAHSGRSGLLVADDDPALMKFVLLIVDAANSLGLRLRRISANESPYIELRNSWDELIAGLPKKMRWTIRKGEKTLSEKGKLEYKYICEAQSVSFLLESILEIERSSWKEESRTSLTAQTWQQEFFEALIGIAAEAGILSAHLLCLDGEPIAYVLGLEAGDGVFLDLKESFSSAHADFSPGHVLKRFVMESLIARGVHTYDFMGQCETYKMRWTNKTYRSLTYALFNSTIGGSIRYMRSRLARNEENLAKRMGKHATEGS